MAGWRKPVAVRNEQRSDFGCYMHNEKAREDGTTLCGLPVHVDGLCFGHWRLRQIRDEDVRQAGASDASWCLRHGLNTLAEARAEASRLSKLPNKEPDRSWAKEVLMRDANGEALPVYAVELAQEVYAMPTESEENHG